MYLASEHRKSRFLCREGDQEFFGSVSDQNISYVSYQCDSSAFPILDLLFGTIKQEIPCRTLFLKKFLKTVCKLSSEKVNNKAF